MKGYNSMMVQTAAIAVFALSLITEAPAQSTIQIGLVQPLTGAFAAAGTDVVNGAKIAADEINAKGGVLGKKLELITEDTKSNPTEAAAVAEKLIVRDKVPVLMGASASTATLAVMPKLMEYKVPMLVETSSSSKITTSGNPYIFRIAPPSEVEAVVFGKIVGRIGIKKADFLVVNNDWGRGTADEFSKTLKDNAIAVGLVERMDQGAQDMNAQLVKFKGSGADTLFVTTAVEQLSLVLKQAASLGLNLRIISTGGSQNPDQLITNVGKAADGTWHLVFFVPWAPEATPDPAAAKTFVAEWNSRGLPFGGLTSSFRGYDGIRAITEAVKIAGKAEPEAIRAALWKVDILGLNGPIKFEKDGPKGQESGQSTPNVYLVKIDNGQVTVPKI
ncbi:MAG: ABC transporter substrate-binding protein [Acidobacteriales bacterium]|nr:ABC transporter substrate-binding protein [Terriglobales bacterium]